MENNKQAKNAFLTAEASYLNEEAPLHCMRISRVLPFVTTIALCLVVVSANAQFRKYSNEFLNIGAGARALGMGGANIASANDPTAAYWNPARLTQIQNQVNVGFMHAEYFSGIGKYDFGSVAIPVANNKRTIGLTFLRFGVDDIPNTLFLVDADGRPNYNNIETFSYADYAFLLSMGQVLKKTERSELSMGGSVKVIHRNVGKFAKAWGFGIDAGVSYKTNNWQLAAVVRDVTTTFNTWSFNFTDAEKERLYMTQNDIPEQSTELTAPRLLLGASHRFPLSKKLSLAAEVMLENTFDGKRNTIIKTDFVSIDPRLGLELNVADVFAVRGGVSNFQQALKDGDTTNQQKVWIFQPAVGAGFKMKDAKIDYAFTNLANQDAPLYTHVISLSVVLRKKEVKK